MCFDFNQLSFSPSFCYSLPCSYHNLYLLLLVAAQPSNIWIFLLPVYLLLQFTFGISIECWINGVLIFKLILCNDTCQEDEVVCFKHNASSWPDILNTNFPISGLWKGFDDCGHSVYFKGSALYLIFFANKEA